MLCAVPYCVNYVMLCCVMPCAVVMICHVMLCHGMLCYVARMLCMMSMLVSIVIVVVFCV